MNPHRQVIFILVVVPLSWARPRQSLRLTMPNLSRCRRLSLTSGKGFKCAKIIGAGTSLRAKRRQCASSCSKATNIGFGWVQKCDRAKVSVHIYDKEGKLIEQPDSWQKGPLPLPMSFPRPPIAILSSSRSKSPRRNAPIGRWFTASGKP